MNTNLLNFLRSGLFVVVVAAAGGLVAFAFNVFNAYRVKQETQAALAASRGRAAAAAIVSAVSPGAEGDQARALVSMLVQSTEHTEGWLQRQVAAEYEHARTNLVLWGLVTVGLAVLVRRQVAGGQGAA